MSQLGRISGQVLTDNLSRAGVDLAFETNLLYLDVNNQQIGIRDSTPVYTLDVNGNIRTTDLTVTTQAALGNLRINAPNTFTTSVGGIDVYINGGGEISHDRLATANLVLDGNLISSISNSNIVFNPNGSGTVELRATTDITGNLAVSGNISMGGNLTTLGTLIVGDSPIDTVTISPDFTQSIIPGDDATYAIGADAGDSTQRRWSQIHAAQWQNITNGTWAGSGIVSPFVTVSDQVTIDGLLGKISAIQSNEDVWLNPYTGITRIENINWQVNDITNLLNTPLTFSSTGTGYVRFMDTTGFVVPAGTILQRRASPEVGETRWNTDLDYLECYDGSVWAVSTGGGDLVTQQFMEDLGFIYSAILG